MNQHSSIRGLTLRRIFICLPFLFTTLCGVLLIAHGPIEQLAHYHEFADLSDFLGVPHAADVFSNLGFAVVAIWGMYRLWPMRKHASIEAGWIGYRLFLAGLLLTALGSGFYHLAPDNARLLWDRLPIAFACAGLLSAVRAENVPNVNRKTDANVLVLFAIFSVAWWYVTDAYGAGDLRPYLFLQGLPLILIPLWQTIYRAPKSDRIAFGGALLLYILAKVTEIYDHDIFQLGSVISGHTMKHLLASIAAGVLVGRLVQRIKTHAAQDDSLC
ncbi:hypothetical protein [Undibacterium sp. RTI2.1]|uniref:hypothetical protein n=1 Tax=Undibacterium sp. RTI2.1 TaxID=3048637 RepID=UPI002B22B77D|nr:hypothetical protein [Undibacterium sp. RTI2.1]